MNSILNSVIDYEKGCIRLTYEKVLESLCCEKVYHK